MHLGFKYHTDQRTLYQLRTLIQGSDTMLTQTHKKMHDKWGIVGRGMVTSLPENTYSAGKHFKRRIILFPNLF